MSEQTNQTPWNYVHFHISENYVGLSISTNTTAVIIIINNLIVPKECALHHCRNTFVNARATKRNIASKIYAVHV